MSYARINTMTFVSAEAADTMQAQYAETAPSSFTEATLLTFVRTGANHSIAYVRLPGSRCL